MSPKSSHVLHPIHGYKVKPTESLKTVKRNERERHRVQHLNQGFDILRQNIPAVAAMKKMSKIQILSHAVGYIQYLHQLLDTQEQAGVKTEPGYPEYYHGHYQGPYTQAPAPLTPVSPVYQSDNSDTSGVFSDYSLHSPVWTPQQQQQQQHYSHFQQQQHVTSTTEQISSDEEEDVIEAIAEWQHIQQ